MVYKRSFPLTAFCIRPYFLRVQDGELGRPLIGRCSQPIRGSFSSLYVKRIDKWTRSKIKQGRDEILSEVGKVLESIP